MASRLRIGELLVSAGVITPEQLEQALGVERPSGQRLGELLVERGLVTDAQLTQVLGQQLSVPWVSLYHVEFSRQLLNLVPREVAEKYCLIPIYVRRVKKQDTLYVAMDDPTNEGALVEVTEHALLPVKPMIASPSDIKNAIRVYYGGVPDPTSSDNVEAAPTPSEGTATPRAPARPPPPAKPTKPSALPASASSAAAANQPPPSVREEPREPPVRTRRGAVPLVAITMLDGTTLRLPARRKGDALKPAPAPDALTARDLIKALRAVAQGADASAVLGEKVAWEPLFAALLSVLLRKGLVADWEFIEEYRAMATK